MLGVSLDGFNVFDALVDDIASHALRRTRRASANPRTLGERLLEPGQPDEAVAQIHCHPVER